MGLLLVRSAEYNQFAGNLRARAQRTSTDPAPRQFLRHQAHDQLVESKPAKLLGNADSERLEADHRLDDFVGNQIVRQVPFVHVWDDPRVGEATILIANGIQVRIVQRLAGPTALPQLGDKFPARVREVFFEQRGARIRQSAPGCTNSQITGTQQFVLPHRQPTDELADRFGKAEPHNHRVKRIGALRPFKQRLERGNAVAIQAKPWAARCSASMRLAASRFASAACAAI